MNLPGRTIPSLLLFAPLIAAAAAAAAGCHGAMGGGDGPPSGGPSPSTPPAQPGGWDDQLRLPDAVDLDPDPRVFETRMQARPATKELRAGVQTELWTYDGKMPGPLIRVRKGDRLIVHFTNLLPEDTTIHWHGLRIPVGMDGVPGHSQPLIPPGGTFRYDFTVPDAGLFWYHPHHRSAAQLGEGLYGALLVEDPDEPRGLGDPLVMVLSDASVTDSGQLAPPDGGGDIATLFGREGDILLINGRVRPVVRGRAGLPQRWRLVNAARSRYYQLAMQGHRFVRIGGDGGLLPWPVESDRLLLIPGERADVVVVPRGAPGSEVPLRWVAFDRGWGTAFMRPDEEVLRLRLTDDPAVEPPPLPPTGRVVAPLDLTGATPVSIEFTRNDVNRKFALGVNGKAFGGDDHIQARVGETQVWTIGNGIDWAHPFHLHGFFFQVLDPSGAPVLPGEWKDTVDVPVRGKVQIAVKYDDRPGMWMFHCHILDHADAGMMAMLLVAPR